MHDGEADPWGVLLYLGQQNQQLLLNILLLHQPTQLLLRLLLNRLAKLPMKLPSLLLVLVMKVVVDKLGREGIEKLFQLLWRERNLLDLLPHPVPCVPS